MKWLDFARYRPVLGFAHRKWKKSRVTPPIKILAIPVLIISAALLLSAYLVFWQKDNVTKQEGLAPGDLAAPAGSEEKFAYLAGQSSNGCGLQQATVFNYPDEQRIQGSCCDKMDLSAYQQQIEELKQYSAIKEIPADPYDVSVANAKQLLAFKDEIVLTSDQQEIYAQAAELSEEGGPCCCKCWHWDAYEGLAKYLIANYDWGSQQVADLWDHSNACGGGHEHG